MIKKLAWFVPIFLTVPLLLLAQKSGFGPQRITPSEMDWSKSVANQPGSGMQPGLDTIFIIGDGNKKELYSLMFKIPAHTAIQPHSHPDDRSCFVLSGLWYFGYGDKRDESKFRALPVGSNYTEPGGMIHFAGTKAQAVLLECTGVGPTGTTFVKTDDDPRKKK